MTPSRTAPPQGRVLIFKLGGHARLSAFDANIPPMPPPPTVHASPAMIANGSKTYANYCAGCHGFGVVSGNVTPDLRRSSAIGDARVFKQIVQGGLLANNGMPKFGTQFSDTDLGGLRAYIADEARFVYDTQRAGKVAR
jgi:quinohemoprotein ethanol dehydrogenase